MGLGSAVNLEVDVIARYLERLMQYDQASTRSHDAADRVILREMDQVLSDA